MKRYYYRFLFHVMDIHGIRHQRSRHVSLQRLIMMGV